MKLTWHIGDVIRKLRDAHGWNQSTFGKKAGLNKATVVMLEKTPEGTKTETVTKAALTLGLSVGELYALVPQEALVHSRDEAPRVQIGGSPEDVRILVASAPVSAKAPTTNDPVKQRDELWAAIPKGSYPAALEVLRRLAQARLPASEVQAPSQTRKSEIPQKATGSYRGKKRA